VVPPDSTDDLAGIKELLFREGYVKVDYDMVTNALSERNGQLIKVSNTLAKFNKEDNIIVSISGNEMEAYISLLPSDSDQTISAQEIEYKLWASGVRNGINKEVIGNIANRHGIVKNITVAYGTPPENGQDAAIKYLFDTNVSNAPILLEDGSVDFYQLNLIKCVDEGQQLAEKVPPTLGKNGRTVNGKSVPATPGKDIVLKPGQNTQVDQSGNKLFAKKGGHVFVHNGLVSIENIYVVKGDVDFSTGNISFLGDVIIRGDVRTGFEVKAGGDIKINGSVEGARIVSSHGSIFIKESVQGANRAELIADKNVEVKFISNCKVKANETIKIAKYAAHSQLEAGDMIDISGSGSRVFGGCLKSASRMSLFNLGNESGTKTEVHIEDFLTRELQEKMNVNKEESENVKKKLELAMKDKQEVARLGTNINKISSTHRDKLLVSVREIPSLTERMNELTNELKEIQSHLKPREKGGRIEVMGDVFPNVEVYFNNALFEVKQKKKKVTFFSDGSNIKQSQG